MTCRSILQLTCAALIVGLLPLQLQAATFVVTKPADTNDGNCNADCSLREAIDAANTTAGADTITVPADTYNLTLGELVISEQLTVNGGGQATTIVDGQAADRVFDINTGITVNMSGLTVRNGDIGGGDGGGIRNDGSLTLTNVTVSDNVATKGGGIHSDGAATALFFVNVTVTDNTAEEGGGIYLKTAGAALTMTGGSISDNAATDKDGGGIRNDRGNVTLTGVTVSGNTAEKKGGAINSKESEAVLNITNSTFAQNTAKDKGGAINNEKGSTITIDASTFDDNTGKKGGAIHSKDAASSATITDSTFVSNQTDDQDGGAIFFEDGTLLISRTTLNGNVAQRDGGALGLKNATATLTNVTLSGNSAPGDDGGAMLTENGTTQLNNVTVTGNSAANGGGLFMKAGTISLFNTIVANSPSGGNCNGAVTSLGTNLDSANTCGLGGTGDLINSAPNLGVLQNNGGLTLTHALGIGSTAIDTGNNTGCPATDQRGVGRPIDGDGNAVSVCDIGAFEAPPTNAANLALVKTDSADPVNIGSAFSYTLTTTNNGTVDATNVTLVDTLPATVVWQSATPSQGSCSHSGEPAGGTVTCTLGTIVNGANATVDIGVDAPGTIGTLTNTATVSADEYDPDTNDNDASEDTTVIDPSANLAVSQVEDFDPAGINLPFVYTIQVLNNGPTDATLVSLVDTLDTAVSFQTAVPSQGSCSEAGGVVTCNLGTIANTATATIDITVTAPATPQTVTNSVGVSTADPDPDLSDNTSVENTAVIVAPTTDLVLTKTGNPNPVTASGALTYTLTINNIGVGPATLTQLTDTLPATVTFVSATPSQGSCSQTGGPLGGTVDCALGVILNGASASVDIVVTAPAIAGLITNNASVSNARVDVNPGNNSASVNTLVIVPGNVDLALSKSDSADPVLVDQTFSYSLVVDNLGPDDATDVVLIDTLPVTTGFQSVVTSQGSCSEASGTVTCNLGTIANGANATVDIIVTAPPSAGTITNNASTATSSIDANGANDTASENTTIQNLNVNQLCYLVADFGGGGGGNDLLTRIDTADFNPATNETNIGVGTGTNGIEAIAWNSATGVLYGANAGQLGILNTTTGVFAALPANFGTGSGAFGNINFTDVDGLTYNPISNILYGVEAQGGTDVLIQINMATGAHVPNAFGAGLDYVPLPPIGGNNITDDIAVDPTTGILYGTVNNGGSTDRLITIDKDTGATTDVALITVPDIEGLGTDPTGQLWGTSGTQNVLYEIDKTTGAGSNGRPIDNGGDYESVDCYGFSPTVTVDLGITKIVDNAAPAENGTINYTVTVSNAGPSTATTTQIMDALPAGVTYVSAVPSQGTYDNAMGEWFVGTLGAGNNATLDIQVTVDTGTAGTTITNTASVSYLSQVDENPGNDSASVDINPAAASLLVLKSVSTVRDPLGAVAPNAHSIPGAVVEYSISISNSGGADATEVIFTDLLTANLSFLSDEYNGGAADIAITVGAAAPVYCIAEIGGDTNADGCFLNGAGDFLSVSIPVSGSYPTGLTIGTTAPNNVVVIRFRATIN
jgi:uncharacterized repeat protein (TIGR01451 family)/CSLREA domain-containing protein